MNIVLIGYRGSGKSAVGRELARRLGWPHVDVDALIQERAGRCIREIFAEFGEPHFRELEAALVEELAARDQHVISAGGGAILRASNVAALRTRGRLVWLTAPPEVLWARIQADTATAANRPNLTADGGFEEVRRVLERRTPAYQFAAELIIDTARLDPAAVAAQVIGTLGPDIAAI